MSIYTTSQSFHSMIGSKGSKSDPGSITHPYRSIMEDTIFPRCLPVGTPHKGPESYTRTLSTLGHGIALWNAVGSMSPGRKKKHLQTGINIGDVGYLGPREGEFVYLFNIFSNPTDEIQVNCPPDFEPLSPPAPENLIKTEGYFPPGTVLASEGVTVSRLAAAPLDVEITVHGRQSGVLILPDGASREDLVSTDLVRRYVRDNAVGWYGFVNESSESICPNGQLYVITGCDKASTFAAAISSPGRYALPPSAHFQDGRWKRIQFLGTTRDYTSEVHTCTVIIRGMQVAVGVADWIRYILQNEPPLRLPYYEVPAVPLKGLRAKWQSMKEKRSNYDEKGATGPTRLVQFQPLLVLLMFLLQESPKAKITIAEDSIWCSLAHTCDGSIPQVVRMLRKILEEHKICEEDGLLILVPRGRQLEDTSTIPPFKFLLRGSNLIRNQYQIQSRRWSVARKLAKVFPGRGLPNNMLS